MSQGRIPRPYLNDVPPEGSDPMIVMVPFEKMGIGARSSGLPKGNLNELRSIEHVGGSAGKKG